MRPFFVTAIPKAIYDSLQDKVAILSYRNLQNIVSVNDVVFYSVFESEVLKALPVLSDIRPVGSMEGNVSWLASINEGKVEGKKALLKGYSMSPTALLPAMTIEVINGDTMVLVVGDQGSDTQITDDFVSRFYSEVLASIRPYVTLAELQELSVYRAFVSCV